MSEWKQQLIPGQDRDCIHGQLARSCLVCDLEHQLFDLTAENAKLKAIVARDALKLSNSPLEFDKPAS